MKEEARSNWVVKYTEFLIQYRWWVLLASIGLALLAGSGGRLLTFTNNYRVFFGKDNPQLRAFEEVENTYIKNDNVLFIFTPKTGKLFSATNLSLVESFTKQAWKIPHSTRVDSITNFQHTIAKGDDLFVDDLVSNAASKTEEEILALKEVAFNEPILVNRLIKPNSESTGINVSIQLPGKNVEEVFVVSNAVRKLRDDFTRQHPNIEIRISGVVMMNNAFAESGKKDMSSLTPLMYAVMLTIMVFLLRSFWATLGALGVIIFSTIATMGTAGYLGFKLTPPSAIAPTIVLTLAIADSIHILMTMLSLIRKGKSSREALIESMRINMQAVFLTSLTTVIGFLCLNFSDAPPYHDLGNITAMGVSLAFLYSVVLLPALMAIFQSANRRM